MKTFEVVLTKSYKIKIMAKSANSAREFSYFFTSDIIDLSSDEDRKNNNFKIENIDRKVNEVFEINEVSENN